MEGVFLKKNLFGGVGWVKRVFFSFSKKAHGGVKQGFFFEKHGFFFENEKFFLYFFFIFDFIINILKAVNYPHGGFTDVHH